MKSPYSIIDYHAASQIKKTELNEMWICRMMAGTASVSFNLHEYEIAANDCFVVTEGDLFKVHSMSDDMEMETLVIDSSFLNIVYPFFGSEVDWGKMDGKLRILQSLEPPYDQLLLWDYESLRCMIRQPQEAVNQKMMLSMMAHFLMTYYKAVVSHSQNEETINGKRSYQLMTRFYELLSEQHPLVHRATDYYADQMNISVRHLFKVCKNETGQTPKEVINEFLVGEIKNVLLTSDLSNQQIAERFDFPDQSAFGQYFKRHVGMSPSEFRREYE